MNTYTFFHSHNLITRNHYNFLKTFWAIHTTLYRVYCIEYNCMIYCVFRIPNVFFFLAFKQFDSTKPTQLFKNLWTYDSMKPLQLFKNILGNSHDFVSCILYWIQCYDILCILYSKCIFLAFKQFDSTKPTQLFKTLWKHTHFFIHTI